MDMQQATCLSHSAPLGHMFEHLDDLLLGQLSPPENSAFAFRKAVLASPTPQHPPLILTIAIANGEIFGISLAVVWALGILTTELRKIVHDPPMSVQLRATQPVAPVATHSRSAAMSAIGMIHKAFFYPLIFLPSSFRFQSRVGLQFPQEERG